MLCRLNKGLLNSLPVYFSVYVYKITSINLGGEIPDQQVIIPRLQLQPFGKRVVNIFLSFDRSMCLNIYL